ncbi:hypothetical protein Tco_1221508 [Tanacetum coccineum]
MDPARNSPCSWQCPSCRQQCRVYGEVLFHMRNCAAADEEDDSDVDLFGEETEEEKKALEEHAAAVKASGKKKECKLVFILSLARQRSSGKNKRKEIGNDSGNRSKKIKGNDSGNRSKNIDGQRFRESPLCTANRRRKKITGNDSGNHSKRTEDNDSGNRSRKRSQRFRNRSHKKIQTIQGFRFKKRGDESLP